MRAAFVADVHIANHKRFGGPSRSGINTRCRLVLDALAAAVAQANAAQAEAFVVLGDLFDDTRPSPQIITATREVLSAAAMDVHIIVGNHDQNSADAGDHALGPLASRGQIFVHEQPTIVQLHNGLLMLIPYRTGNARGWLPQEIARLAAVAPRDTPLALGVHLGVSDDKTPIFMHGAHDSIEAATLDVLMKQHGITQAFTGNWHKHRNWEFTDDDGTVRKIVQCGALAPTGFDNPGVMYGSVILDSVDSWRRVLIPGPRFISAEWEDLNLDDLQDLADEGHKVFVQARAQPAYLTGAVAEIKARVDKGLLAGGEAIPNAHMTKLIARSAAQGARSASSIDDAVASFIGRMQMPDGVDRTNVHAIVKTCLAK